MKNWIRKYLYPKETLDEIKEFFTNEFNDLFPNKLVKYIILKK